jgi:ATP-binding cassette subfamily F protein uup
MPREDANEKAGEHTNVQGITNAIVVDRKPKLSFKEKQELAQLEQDIDTLETEKRQIEADLCSGTLSVDELTRLSKRLPELNDEIELKTLRWMELEAVNG